MASDPKATTMSEHEKRMAELRDKWQTALDADEPYSACRDDDMCDAAWAELLAYADSLASERDRLAAELSQERAARERAERVVEIARGLMIAYDDATSKADETGDDR